MMWKLHIPVPGLSSYSGFWPHVICYSWLMHTFFLFIFCKHLCIIIHSRVSSDFPWLADVAKLVPCIQERRAFLTTAKWDPDRIQSAASMSVLVILSYPWQETISFLNINQKWSQATDFTSRSKFGAVQIWPDILGLGPGLTLLRKQFDISSSGKLPSPGAHPRGLALRCRKLSRWSGFFKSPRLSLLQLIQLLQWRARAFHDAAVTFGFLRALKPRRIGCSAALCCSCRGKKAIKW